MSIDTTPPPRADDTAEQSVDEPRPPRPSVRSGLLALGVALLASGTALSVGYSRHQGPVDVSVYGVAVAATAVLLLLAALSGWIDRGAGPEAHDITAWAGAAGIVSLIATIGVAFVDFAGLGYLLGGIAFALSAVGYAATRRGAFVVSGILGFGLVYLSAYGDVVGEVGPDQHGVAVIAATLLAFVLVVTLVGMPLRTRTLSALVSGWIGVAGFGLLLGNLAIATYFARMFGDMFDEFEEFGWDDEAVDGPELAWDDEEWAGTEPPWGGSEPMDGPVVAPPFAPGGPEPFGTEHITTDVWVILAIVGALTLFWAAAAALTRNAGFTLLAVVLPVVTVPPAAYVLLTRHPTIWAGVLVGSGALVLGAAALLAIRRHKELPVGGAR